MRTFLTIITIFCFSLLNAQDSVDTKAEQEMVTSDNEADALSEAFTRNADKALGSLGGGFNATGYYFAFVNPKRDAIGSIYLFEKWENIGVLVTKDNKKYTVNNININLKNQTYQSRFTEEKMFNYNFNEVDKFIINNKVYKNYFYDEDNRIYEVIYESEDFSILKGYKLVLVEGSANPMLNRKMDKYIQKKSYFLKTENSIQPFKLGKNKITKLLSEDETLRKKIVQYAKENSLSFKDDFELSKILEYSETIN